MALVRGVDGAMRLFIRSEEKCRERSLEAIEVMTCAHRAHRAHRAVRCSPQRESQPIAGDN